MVYYLILQTALNDWRGWRSANIPGYQQNQQPPRNIIFYRDGVSEGEFSQVARHEIPLIKGESSRHSGMHHPVLTELPPVPEAFRHSGLPEQMWPKLLFIVVGKRCTSLSS